MTPSPIETLPEQGRNVYRSASLVAIACVLQIAESMVPYPIPGVRLGLANMVTLVTMADLGFASAMEVAVLRTVVSSLILGSFLSPGFMLSFSSAVVSTAVMCALWRFSLAFPAWGFSLIGISIASAVAHNATQLCMAYLVMIKHKSIFYFAPWLVISGVLMGWLTGLVAAEVLKGLKKGAARADAPLSPARAEPARPAANAFLRGLAPEWKITGAALMICFVLLSKNRLAFPSAASVLLALMLFTRLRAAQYSLVLRKLRGISSLAAFSFIFPALFGHADGGALLFSAGPVNITAGGLANGAFFASRIMLMAWTGFLLNLYASPEEIAAGMRRLGRPLGFFGVPVERFAAIISISWSEIPSFSARAKAVISGRFSGGGGWKRRPLGWFVELTAGVVSAMYCGRDAAGLDLEGKAA
ncbi:MAG: Gx transporter family protein [Elusimicrobia bacterium]|nr:Gx transporter family protein [Elusimicrobiota bacterium]